MMKSLAKYSLIALCGVTIAEGMENFMKEIPTFAFNSNSSYSVSESKDEEAMDVDTAKDEDQIISALEKLRISTKNSMIDVSNQHKVSRPDNFRSMPLLSSAFSLKGPRNPPPVRRRLDFSDAALNEYSSNIPLNEYHANKKEMKKKMKALKF